MMRGHWEARVMLESRTITTASVGNALCTLAMGNGEGDRAIQTINCGHLSHVSSPAHPDRDT